MASLRSLLAAPRRSWRFGRYLAGSVTAPGSSWERNWSGALQFALIYVAQRQLGPTVFGQLTYALALGVVLTPLTDLGVQLTMTQQIARAPHQAQSITGVGLSLKLTLATAACLVLATVSQTRPDDVRAATFILGLAMIIGSFGEFFGYTFRGLQRVELDAALTLLTRTLTVVVGFWTAGRRSRAGRRRGRVSRRQPRRRGRRVALAPSPLLHSDPVVPAGDLE